MTDSEFGKVFLDTAPIIYYLEENETYYPGMKVFLRGCYENGAIFQTSVATVEEYHVYPYRNNDISVIGRFRRFLDDFEIRVYEIDYYTALAAARLRAKYKGIKAMDALQLACAIQHNADIFLTNDRQLRQCEEINVRLAEEL